MNKIFLAAFSALIISTGAFADDWCQLGLACPIYNDLLLTPPYIGTYTCYLSAGDMEDINIEITMMTKNTIAEPASLILSRGPHSNGKNSGELKIKKNPATPAEASLKNAISISGPKQLVRCDYTKPNTCNVPRTVMCIRTGN